MDSTDKFVYHYPVSPSIDITHSAIYDSDQLGRLGGQK